MAALTVALLMPAAANAGRLTSGMANGTPIDVTTTHGHVNWDDATIVNHLVGLIDRAPRGSTIITNVFRVEPGDRVVAALREAKSTRGVNVWVIYGVGDDSPTDAFDWVNSGTPNGETRMRKCPTGCHNTGNPSGKAHSKYFLFNSTRRTPTAPLQSAVWVSSANLSRGSGSKASNNAVTFYDDADMWWGMWGVWQDAWNRNPRDGDYYRPHLGWQQPHSGVVYSVKAASVAHISPDDDGPDMWAEQLARVDRPSTNCAVRVMHVGLEDARGPAVVDQLRAIGNGGCAVRVLLDTDAATGEANIGSDARRRLCNAPNTQLRKRPRLHDKVMFTRSSYEGHPARVQVFTGSHNLTRNALRDNDEVLLRVADSQDAYDAFYRHFYDVWSDDPLTLRLSGCA